MAGSQRVTKRGRLESVDEVCPSSAVATKMRWKHARSRFTYTPQMSGYRGERRQLAGSQQRPRSTKGCRQSWSERRGSGLHDVTARASDMTGCTRETSGVGPASTCHPSHSPASIAPTPASPRALSFLSEAHQVPCMSLLFPRAYFSPGPFVERNIAEPMFVRRCS